VTGSVSEVHIVVPEGIDDPARPSGGNVYDRRICAGLAALGWSVQVHALPGCWPRPDSTARAALAGILAGLPERAIAVLDGLVASAVPDVLLPEADRLRLVVLMHLPLGETDPAARGPERSTLSTATALLTTSEWTRQRLVQLYGVPARRIEVAEPGVEPAGLAPGTIGGGELLCVAAVTPPKGHDVLLTALADLTDLTWRCVLAGSLDVAPRFVDRLRSQAGEAGIADRVIFVGPCPSRQLDEAYAGADLVVLASRVESYGMVVTEALARGLPVVATAVGGVPEALGWAPTEAMPGVLVPVGDPLALAAALRGWLTDPEQRRSLGEAARARRPTLSGWLHTVRRVSEVLTHLGDRDRTR
jgi:glycosyltransferase involved in cell wall biosynthesis